MTQATLHTSEGPIELELYPEAAPKTVENFTKLAGEGFYDGLVVPPGDPRLHDPGRLPEGRRHRRPRLHFEDEFNDQVVARRARDGERRPEHERLAVLHRHRRGDCPWLDGKHTVFGRVTSGQDVVDRISLADRDGRDRPRRT